MERRKNPSGVLAARRGAELWLDPSLFDRAVEPEGGFDGGSATGWFYTCAANERTRGTNTGPHFPCCPPTNPMFALLSFLALFTSHPTQTSNPQIAIQDVHVVAGHRNQILEHQTVLISDGKITAIAPAGLLPAPDGYEALDGNGKYLAPGYCDSHAHFPGKSGLEMPPEDYLWMMLANGVTRLRCMRMEDHLPEWQTKVSKGQVQGPTIVAPVAMLTTSNDLQGEKLDAFLEEHRDQPGAFMKMLGGFDEDQYRKIMEATGRTGMRVAGHLPRGISLAVATEMGQLGIEHLRGFPLGKPMAAAEMQNAVATQVKAGVFHCPTVLWYSVQGGNLDAKQAANLSGLDCLPMELRKQWSDWLADPKVDERRTRLQPLETNMLTIVAEMDRQGAELLISASDGTYVIPGFSFHEEAELYKKAGVSPSTTLKAATHNAARFFGEEDQWGSVQVGLRADLVLLDANPLEDSSNLRKIAGVFVNGQHFSKAQLDAGLERIRKRHNGEE